MLPADQIYWSEDKTKATGSAVGDGDDWNDNKCAIIFECKFFCYLWLYRLL